MLPRRTKNYFWLSQHGLNYQLTGLSWSRNHPFSLTKVVSNLGMRCMAWVVCGSIEVWIQITHDCAWSEQQWRWPLSPSSGFQHEARNLGLSSGWQPATWLLSWALYILPTPSVTCRTWQEGLLPSPCTLDRLRYHKHIWIYLKNTQEPQSLGTRAGRVEPMTLNNHSCDQLHLGPREAISPYLLLLLS